MKLLFASLAILVSFNLANCAAVDERSHSIRPRQTEDECTTDRSCYPANFPPNANINSTLVRCANISFTAGGLMCVCEQCFVRNETSQICEIDMPCQSYNITSGVCFDSRFSQQTVFILAVFLTGVGAANFFIGRPEFGGPQIAIFLVFVICLILLCVIRRLAKEYDENLCFVVWANINTIFCIILLLVIVAWWIADVVIFGINSRLDNNGCPTNGNL